MDKKIISFLLALIFSSNCFGSTLGVIAKLLVKSMDGPIRNVAPSAVRQYKFLNHNKGFTKAARMLGENMSSDERKLLAIKLESRLLSEYSARGYPESVLLACADCVPSFLADDINGRVIDIIRKNNDLISRLSIDEKSLSIVDINGNPLLSSRERKEALSVIQDELGFISNKSSSDNWKSFVNKFMKLISKGDAGVEYNSMTNTLSIEAKYGSIKGAIVNIDVKKFLKNFKHYIYGGGLAALGYEAGNSDSKNNDNFLVFTRFSTSKKSKRYVIFNKFGSTELLELKEEAEAEYIIRGM